MNGRKKTRINSNRTPTPIKMDWTAVKTGTTPSHRKRATDDAAYMALCDSCTGMYFAKQVPDPDVSLVVTDASRSNSTTTKKIAMRTQGKKSTTILKDERVRRYCSICKSRTDWYCTGCKRYLCNTPPKIGTKKPKYPKFFVVDSPILDSNGNMTVGRDKSLSTNREVGILSCYLLAHQQGFGKFAAENRQRFIDEGRSRKRRVYLINDQMNPISMRI